MNVAMPGGNAVDEFDVERGVFLRGERDAERVVLEQAEPQKLHHARERVLDLADLSRVIPVMHRFEKVCRVGVENR